MTPSGEGWRISSHDGLRARENGSWGRDKLSFLDYFGLIALLATRKKRERVYVDLFAGPGRNVDPNGGEEYEGSPLRILRMTAPGQEDLRFTDAYFVNLDPDDADALEDRVDLAYERGEAVIPRGRVHLIRGDANRHVNQILRQAHVLAYVFLFADITKPEHWPWTTVSRLREHGHKSIDLYMLFPLGMAIQRLISIDNPEHTEACANALTRFFGTEDWRVLVESRVTNALSRDMRLGLEALYLSQLERFWTYARTVKDVRLRGDQSLYRMLFASDHQAGDDIAAWAHRQEASGQLGLGF